MLLVSEVVAPLAPRELDIGQEGLLPRWATLPVPRGAEGELLRVVLFTCRGHHPRTPLVLDDEDPLLA
jgi:hypothetical protein